MKYKFNTNSKQVLGDLQTPVSIYLKVRDIYPESALLESSDFHGNSNSLSYIALCPLARVSVNSNICSFTFPDRNKEEKTLNENYDVACGINEFLGKFLIEGEDKDKYGLFGYTAFDAVKYFEPIDIKEFHHHENDAPDMLYIMYKYK